ncbi:zinc-binding dehydrogenase [Rhodococcus sp. NPDC057529]|uniref:zinc-binding dehydrogenase n=1 Tax=Rhodococcus sp. NPDC057529 TaxID=3346158 RepID=UPI00366B23BB
MTQKIGHLALMTEPGQLSMAQYEIPEPAPDALVLEILRANVCGSELHIWNGHHPVKKRGGLGHEMIGRIHSLGAEVITDYAGETVSVGDRVVVTYFQTCQRCARCRGGQPNLCDNAYQFFGKQPEEWPHFHAAFGTHYYVHPHQHFYKVPDTVPDSIAAGANCALSQVMFGIDQISLAYGETVLIQGAGGLGLNAAAVAVERGARVIVVDAVPARLEQAKAFGAADVVDISAVTDPTERLAAVHEMLGGEGPDVAIEVTGVPAAFAEGLDLLRRGGRYLVMGNLSPGRTVPFDPGYVTRKALTIKHVDRYEARYLSRALTFLERHQSAYPFDQLVDAEFGLSDVKDALDASAQRKVTRAAITITGAPEPAGRPVTDLHAASAR